MLFYLLIAVQLDFQERFSPTVRAPTDQSPCNDQISGRIAYWDFKSNVCAGISATSTPESLINTMSSVAGKTPAVLKS